MKTKIDLAPYTRYLCGWVSGYEDAKGYRQDDDERGELGIYHAIVHRTRESAEKAATIHREAGRKAYVRAMSYETRNPENAKGMPLLSTIENTFQFLP